MHRRNVLLALAAMPLVASEIEAPASAREGYRVVHVDVRVSSIVSSRTVTDMRRRIASRIGRGGGAGRAVSVTVELRTIDPYRSVQPTRGRAIAARYTVRDASTGRVLAADRFTERTRTRSDEEGSVGAFHIPRSRHAGERDLADEVAAHVLRYAL